MSNHHPEDAKLDAMLRTWKAPAPPEAMAERIIAMAAAEPQSHKTQTVVRLPRPVRPWYAELMLAFALPKPALTLGIALLLGLSIGLGLGATPDDSTISDWSNVFASGEGWL